MKLEAKYIDSANALANGAIPVADIEAKYEKVAKNIAKNVKIAGFRSGKVPTNVVMSRYKENIERDSEQEAIQEFLNLAIEELKVAPNKLMGDPLVTKFEKGEKEIKVEMKLGLSPTIDLSKLDSIIPDVKDISASSKEVDERLKALAESSAPLVEAKKDKKLEGGDVANFDFDGYVDGKPFDGGKADRFDLAIGSGQFIPGFEDGMVGMKAGENRDVEVTFPKDYQAPNLAGKAATFKIKLNSIKIKGEAKIDDEFAKAMLPNEKDVNLNILKGKIKEQLEGEKKMKLYNDELKPKLMEILISSINFDMPEVITEREIDMLFRNNLSSLTPEEFEKMKDDPKAAQKKRDSFREEAQKSVKITFIVDAIAKKDGVRVDDNEVMQAIYYEAMMRREDPKVVMEYYEKNSLLPAIKMAMIEDRVLTLLLDSKAKKGGESKKDAKRDDVKKDDGVKKDIKKEKSPSEKESK